MFKAVIRLAICALSAIALVPPSFGTAQENNEISTQAINNNLNIQRGVGSSVLEILANSAMLY